MKTLQRLLYPALITLLLPGCGYNFYKAKSPKLVNSNYPVAFPRRSSTFFTEGLACMDQMFIDKKVDTILVTSSGIPDYSESRGSAGYGAKEMIMTALSNLSQKSGAIRYVAYDRSTPDIIALQSAHKNKAAFKAPDFFIRGAVTQIESSPYSKQKGYSLNLGSGISSDLENGGAANSNSLSLSSVSLDLNMGMVSSFQLLPGISASNSLSVAKKGSSSELILGFEKVGAIYSVNENSAQALSTALRGLIEVGLIELFGKLYNVPYWECLSSIGANSPSYKEAIKLFQSQDRQKQIEFVANELRRQGLLSEGVTILLNKDGSLTDPVREVIAKYRAIHNIFGSPVVDFILFERIYKDSQLSTDSVKTATAKPVSWLHKN